MEITDTQILSYYFKGNLPLPSSNISISSITAAEFLLIHSKQPHRANYYPILPSILRNHSPGIGYAIPFDSKKHSALGKHRTDQLLLNFNGLIPSFIEFGSSAISNIINDGHSSIFASSISHLNKPTQKILRSRFNFLLQSKVECVAVTPNIATIGMNLLAQFLDKYNEKKNLRNTINDILILSTAIEQASSLLTEDKLLGRFAAECLGATIHEQRPPQVLINFATPDISDRRKPFESKGYINKGWQIQERRGR